MKRLDYLKLKRIIALSIPIIGGMMSQNILNLVDTLMIGHLGHVALAGAGIGGFLFFVSFAAFTGVASGVQTMIARYQGQRNFQLISQAFLLGLVLVFVGSSAVLALEWVFLDEIISLFSTEVLVFDIARQYYFFRMLGLPFLTFCLVVRGFWNGMSKPKRYLMVIVIIHLLNILFNYLFIFGKWGFPMMHAAGAGIASTLSLVIGSLLYAIDCRRYLKLRSLFDVSKTQLTESIKWLLNLGIPTSIQQFFFALGVAVFYWILGQLGTVEMAIGNVLVNIVLVGILPGVGLAMATMTLVSQSLGEKKYDETYYWPFYVCFIAIVGIGGLALFALIFPQLILRPFISDTGVLAQAILPFRIDTVGVFLEVLALIFMYALNGIDRTRLVMVISIVCQWVLLLPIAYFLSLTLGYGLIGAWLSWVVFQAVQLLWFGGIWIKSRKKLLT